MLCPPAVYTVMQQCWAEDRRQRIPFPAIALALAHAAEASATDGSWQPQQDDGRTPIYDEI